MGASNILIIGLGYFGENLALELVNMGHDVIGVDTDMAVVERNAPLLTNAMQLDATNITALRSLEITSFDICIVGRGSDLEESVLITLNLKELGARRVICKALTDQQRKVLERIGADEIVQPERDMAKRLAHMVGTSTDMIDSLDIPGGFGIQEIYCPRGWWKRSIAELKLPSKYGLQLLLIKQGEKFITFPGPEVEPKEGDIMVLFGHNHNLAKLQR
jgi:trk system potassium uptake protein TrkA